jgi:UDP-N-acetylmuramoylalanine--D-glutamate ligase
VRVETTGTLEAAVERAMGIAVEGDVVLLSPACASLDQFRDYVERGNRFAALVHAALAENADA